MGRELVVADWPALTDEDVQAVLACYEETDTAARSADAVVTWWSPRPMSAAALVQWRGDSIFVKRHDIRVRNAVQLAAEHSFANHLRAHGQPVPALLRTATGTTALRHGDWLYEAHHLADGIDLYRDAPSWSPFVSLDHAQAAGAALARFHQAARGFPLARRPVGVLMNSCDVVSAADPLAEMRLLLEGRPGLNQYLVTRPWEADLTRHHVPAIQRARPLLKKLERQWGHGDWHPSNLTWTSTSSTADVASVLDLGLANRTYAIHDLATAIERAGIDWLNLAGADEVHANLDAVDALLDGYETVRPLNSVEADVLPEILPVVHLEYALSEIEYFTDVVHSQTNADLAYDAYLIGHSRWFEGTNGATLLNHLRGRVNPKMLSY